MATSTRRRLSFVDLAHPQVWQKLLEYTEATIALTKLITDFSNQWAKICFLASSQLHQLVNDFRKKTEMEIRGKCHLGGMMYDIWESLLLESEIESRSLKKLGTVMEKQISEQLASFMTNKTREININKQHRRDLDDILQKSHEFVHEIQNDYSKIYNTEGATEKFELIHNQYILELTGANSLYSKYNYNILPQLLQAMEQSQLGTIDTICEKIQLMAAILQEYHEQRQSSFASFVVTSNTTNAQEELENYICSVNDSDHESTTPSIHIKFEPFISPITNNNNNNSRSQNATSVNNEQLIIYAAPVIQMQLSSRCKETIDRLKDIKKERSVLLAVINPQTQKIPVKQHDNQQQSDKKILNQMSDLMKRKHQLRLIELEESVLLAQQDLLKSRRPSMSSNADNDQDAQKRGAKNIKGLWREAVRSLKTSTSSSGTGDDENRSSFVRRISSRKKKHPEREDETIIDPVYETLKEAAETRKRTIANYLQQRQQTLNKQTSLNSQGSSELDIQPSPRVVRHTDATSPTQPQASSLSGKQNSVPQFLPVVDSYQSSRSKK